MKQIIQNYRTGKLELAEVPIPLCSSNIILVKNVSSLVSMGTERSIIELGQESLLGKAKERPDLVKRLIDKAKKEGLFKTFHEALNRLDNPTPLGYSSAGVVVEVGANIHKFSPGDRVACIGAGYAFTLRFGPRLAMLYKQGRLLASKVKSIRLYKNGIASQRGLRGLVLAIVRSPIHINRLKPVIEVLHKRGIDTLMVYDFSAILPRKASAGRWFWANDLAC